ncbi:long-chain fatty acid--CoA ligase [Solimonas sp. K1W22B-7]|uniref:class I adenylate-forming enzyme family protein n=1 Tax=Solimonas sp. K1W22B-7 TaxID=2303331 RepID=UPI000E333089|nr:AMP-binding protein [Solimonas sp. K1W22B-7]AXQ30679.1 long-chain fatty acid--CoA ligase [Solimonas sp. K1W22B-7]
MQATVPPSPSVVHGIPLAEEPGIGSLTIPGYLREVTTRHAEAEALVMHTPDGVERWSYRTLWQKSVEVAKALIACGVGKDSRVGILMTNRPEYLSAVFGTGLAGGVSVGLSSFSTATELEHLVAVSGVSVLLFDGRVLKKDFGGLLTELEPQIRSAAPGQLQSAKFPFLRHLVRLEPVTGTTAQGDVTAACFESWDGFLAQGRAIPDAVVDARAATVTPADAGGLFFSSGTTSLPKGILHAQRAFAIQWWRWPRVMSVEGAVRSWTGNGFFWSGNITMVVGVALSTGGAVVLQPYFEPERALRLMQDERVSFLSGRPHQWARLQEADNWSSTDLSSLRYITNSALMQQHPTVKTDWRLPMSFGATETMTINTSYSADTPVEQYAGSAGVPLPGNILKVIDPLTGAVVPRGARGEICIKGPTLMLGYIGKAVEDSLDDEGYYRTGDGGYVDGIGRLYWEGRLTEIIKTGGANVSPLEIDAVLALCPGVRRAQTVGVPHETLGEIAVACVIPHEGVQLVEDEMRAFLKERLASFKVPRRFLFLHEEDMAVTGNGKVKSGELRQLAAQRLGVVLAAAPAA